MCKYNNSRGAARRRAIQMRSRRCEAPEAGPSSSLYFSASSSSSLSFSSIGNFLSPATDVELASSFEFYPKQYTRSGLHV